MPGERDDLGVHLVGRGVVANGEQLFPGFQLDQQIGPDFVPNGPPAKGHIGPQAVAELPQGSGVDAVRFHEVTSNCGPL